MALLFALSSWPSPPGLPAGVDKELHWVLYSGLSALVLRALARRDWRSVGWGRTFAAVIVAAAYGATDEYHQSFVPGRSAEVADLVADACGAAAAAIAIRLWSRMKSTDGL